MKPFLLRVGLFAALQLAIFLGLFFSARAGPDPFIGALRLKHARAQASNGPRLLLVGGSNLPFGMHSEVLATALPHLAPVNLGLHAGLGLDFILADARGVVRVGDLVVVSLEYALFDPWVPTTELWEGLLLRPTIVGRLHPRPLLDSGFQFIAHVARRGRRHLLGSHAAPRTGIYSLASFNAYGDVAAHRALPPQRPMLYPADESQARGDPRSVDRQLRRLARWVNDCERRGAQVVFFLPPIPEVSFEVDQRAIHLVVTRLREVFGARLLGELRDIPRPESDFFDTPFHLVGPAGLDRTRAMIERIRDHRAPRAESMDR